MKVIGLTGGIASGKGLIASFFRKRKIPVIDADQLARDVVRPGQKAYREIIAVFGPTLLGRDKTIDRKKLGDLVFADAGRRKLLESITHPEILKGIHLKIRNFEKKRAKLVVVDAALLFESGLYKKMDRNLLVVCSPAVQLKRLMKRDKLTEPAAWARILSQLPTAQKQRLADFVVDNSGSRAATEKQFAKIVAVFGHDRGRRRKKVVGRGP